MPDRASRAARPETACLLADAIRPRRRRSRRATCAAPGKGAAANRFFPMVRTRTERLSVRVLSDRSCSKVLRT